MRTPRPTEALAWLEDDPFYRWATYLYLPCQYLSLVFACWLWAGGGWLTMSLWDKFGLMVTVGFIGGCAINVAHQLGHTRAVRKATRQGRPCPELLRALLRGAQPRSPRPGRHPRRPSQLTTRGESLCVHSQVSSRQRRLRMAYRGQAVGSQGPLSVDDAQRCAQRVGDECRAVLGSRALVRSGSDSVVVRASGGRCVSAGDGQLHGALRPAQAKVAQRPLRTGPAGAQLE